MINRIINNQPKELANKIRIINGQPKECQNIVKIVNGQSKEIWSGNKAYKLGDATTFNIQELLPKVKYNTLTLNNFFYLTAKNASTSDSASGSEHMCHCNSYCYYTAEAGTYRKYNIETGELNHGTMTSNTCNTGCNSCDSIYGSETVLVLKPEKLIFIGNLLNVNNYNIQEILPNIDYTTLTADNFIVRANGNNYSQKRVKEHETWSGSVSSSISFTKNYNSQTGILNIGFSSNIPQEIYFVKRLYEV